MAKKDNTVKSFILRVDADMMEAIEAWAADEFRSTNGTVISCETICTRTGLCRTISKSSNTTALR